MTLYQPGADSGSPFEDTTLEDTSAAAAPPPPARELVPGNAPSDPLESDGSLAEAFGGFVRGTLQALPRAFSRKWWLGTLLILIGMAFLVRLGLWQLDRLQERRAFNSLVAERWQQTPFDLQHEALPADLESMGYRRVEVANGNFDYANQIMLSNQPGINGEPGIQLVTPYVLDDGRAVLVSRGWVPEYLAGEENWGNLEEDDAGRNVVGLLQRSQELEGSQPPATALKAWYTLNIPQIQRQMPYELLPVFILQLPDGNQGIEEYPLRSEPIALDEGSHFSYAIQWFMFAAILGFGYIQLIRWQDERSHRLAQQPQAEVDADWAAWDENESSLDDARTLKHD
jgi:surfeit locus 1 family protein